MITEILVSLVGFYSSRELRMTDVGLLLNFNLLRLHQFEWQKPVSNHTDGQAVTFLCRGGTDSWMHSLSLGFSQFVFWESLVKLFNAPRCNSSQSYSVQGSLWGSYRSTLHKLPRYILPSSQILQTSPIFIRSAANITCFAPSLSVLISTRRGLWGRKFEHLWSPLSPFQQKFFQNSSLLTIRNKS